MGVVDVLLFFDEFTKKCAVDILNQKKYISLEIATAGGVLLVKIIYFLANIVFIFSHSCN